MELVIEGNVFFGGRVQKLALGIEDGSIVQVKKTIRGVRSTDFGDRLVIPGAVDAHVHFREPGMTQKEDFQSGTTAAACGGVTTVLDMPNTRPSTIWRSSLLEKAALARPKACVDFGLFAALVPSTGPQTLADLAVGFKLYMGSTTGDLLVDDYSRLREMLAGAARTGRPVAVHAEDERLLRSLKVRQKDLLTYDESRPSAAEVGAVRRFLAALEGGRGHVCHITTRGALEALGRLPPGKGQKGQSGDAKEGLPVAGQEEPPAQEKGLAPPGGTANSERGPPALANGRSSGRLSCEVTPHHLLLDARRDSALSTLGKVNPPLRTADEREALWKAFAAGGIELLASDHAPHLMEEKETGFGEAPPGVPGTETMVPLMMMLIKGGRLDIGRLVEASCAAPAALYGLDAGRLAVGQPAHLAVYDLHDVQKIRGKALHSKCAWSPFEGRDAIFPRAVFLRGELIVEDGEPVEFGQVLLVVEPS